VKTGVLAILHAEPHSQLKIAAWNLRLGITFAFHSHFEHIFETPNQFATALKPPGGLGGFSGVRPFP
jgi:hypothetical protein